MKFVPKRELWLSIVIGMTVIVLIGCGLTPIFVEGAGIVGGVLIFSVCQALAGFTSWLWLGISYTLSDHHLIIKCGPIKYTIAYSSMIQAKPIRSWMSSMATSSRRIEIRYGKYGVVHISPLDEDGFLSELKLRAHKLGCLFEFG